MIIGINLAAGCLFYYVFIKLVRRVRFADAVPLIVVGAVGFIIGCIVFLRKTRDESHLRISFKQVMIFSILFILTAILLFITASIPRT